MVRVCDAIMGSGKTESAISYMNAHPDKKFIYVTPYLKEAARITKGCPRLYFQEPSDKRPEFNFSKTAHAADLIKHGYNIATTHQAICLYPPEMIDCIKDMGYTLIIDEELQVLMKTKREEFWFNQGDLDDLVENGYIQRDGDIYSVTGKEYTGSAYTRLIHMIRVRSLLCISDGDAMFDYYWVFPAEFIKAFTDVFLLTYMFDCQDMKAFLEMNDIPYTKISTMRTEDGRYEFDMDMSSGWMPEYTKHLKDKIHIENDFKLNAVGNDYHAISMNWFKKKENAGAVKQLKDNLYNYFRHHHSGTQSADRMYGTYDEDKTKIRGFGYSSGYVVFNARATNEFRDRTVLAYCSNIFQNKKKKNYLSSIGFSPSDDLFALSNMTQWIWRSAIRQGKDIYIYIPSRRMRNLLIDWINSFDKGGECA